MESTSYWILSRPSTSQQVMQQLNKNTKNARIDFKTEMRNK